MRGECKHCSNGSWKDAEVLAGHIRIRAEEAVHHFTISRTAFSLGPGTSYNGKEFLLSIVDTEY